jgi:hypothetical protein
MTTLPHILLTDSPVILDKTYRVCAQVCARHVPSGYYVPTSCLI